MRRKKDKSNGITALYERLSRDDDNAGESNSIVHQKQMLEDYAMKHGFTNLVHFTDDGWSGATFDRPSWNRLVEGVKNGEITACICKDMSRIGRDHLQVGFFTDILFREKEVRFIAINNGIDSDRQETSEFAPFLNIMNEWFVRDTSKKIKAVLKSRGSSGNAHTSNIPPYGYLKDPENPDHWIIDEEAAEVVRRIYRMTIEGKGPYQIARELSEEKIERPSYYLGKKGLGNHASNYDKENPYMWRGNQVTTLIARPEYIGKTVNFRTFKNSYKDKKVKRTNKEDWVVFDDTVKVDQNGAVVEIEITNKLIRGSVQLTKVDKDYPDHHLSGAVFGVYRDGKLVGQMEELSDGVYKLDDLPYGDYTLKETEAPKGFVLDEKTYSFSVKENGKTVIVETEAGKGFVNQAQTGGIRIEKTSDDGVLKGFTFRVEGSDITGNAFSKDFVTDEKGQIHIDGLRIGDYVISEVSNKANEKYELPANVTVTVHEGKTVVAKFHNKLKPVTDIPKTGDTTNMPLWAALAGISAIGAGAAAFFTFRKKKEVGKHER